MGRPQHFVRNGDASSFVTVSSWFGAAPSSAAALSGAGSSLANEGSSSVPAPEVAALSSGLSIIAEIWIGEKNLCDLFSLS